MEPPEKQKQTEAAPTSSTDPKSSQPKKLSVQTDPELLTQVVFARLKQRIRPRGEIVMPCVPAVLDYYMESLAKLFEAIGKTFSSEELEQLRDVLAKKLEEGFRTSPHANIVFTYEPDKSPSTGISCNIKVAVSSVAEQYKHWTETRKPPLFGKEPDAKVMDIAAQLGEPSTIPILDIGAGTGRNTLPLARLGHPVDVVEFTPEFIQQIQETTTAEGLTVNITQGDILDPLVRMRPAYYQLIILSEVVSHFRDPDQVRLLLAKMCDCLLSGGLLLLSIFLAVDEYEPDLLARQMSQAVWSYMMTRAEVRAAMEKLPLELVSDESVFDYEREHLPAEAWPPTGWFVNWVSGRDLFGFTYQKPPMELRWLLFKRL